MKKNRRYRIGSGISDITPPIANVATAYHRRLEKNGGIQSRLFCRTFLIVHCESKSSFIHSTIDYCYVSHSIKLKVIENLNKKFDSKFNHENVCLCANNSNLSPIGSSFLNFFNYSCGGHDGEILNIIVSGIVSSVEIAHQNMSKSGRVFVDSIYFKRNFFVNSSQSHYRNNPSEERKKFEEKNGCDTNSRMVVLSLEDEEKELIGMITWCACPGQVMGSREYISSETLGLASILVEKHVFYQKFGNKRKYFPGMNSKNFQFIASFAQMGGGDVSANVRVDFGRNPCKYFSYMEMKRSGIGDNAEDTALQIARKIAGKAFKLALNRRNSVIGPIESSLKFVDTSNIIIKKEYCSNQRGVKTTYPAVGNVKKTRHYDAPFHEMFDSGNFTGKLKRLKKKIAKGVKDYDNHSNKEIILSGSLNASRTSCFRKNDMTDVLFPRVLPYQIIVIGKKKKNYNDERRKEKEARDNEKDIIKPKTLFDGNSVVIIATPFQISSVAEFRMKNIITNTLFKKGKGILYEKNHVFVQSFSNHHACHVVTPEEYDLCENEDNKDGAVGEKTEKCQSMEGCLTLFGRNTLNGIIQEFDKVCHSLEYKDEAEMEISNNYKNVPVFEKKKIIKRKFVDKYKEKTPLFKSFGSIKTQPRKYEFFNELVIMEVYTGNPRNEVRVGESYFKIEKNYETKEGKMWKTVRKDSNIDTKLLWERKGKIYTVKILWHPEKGIDKEGYYRICFYGCYSSRSVLNNFEVEKHRFVAISNVFYLVDTYN